MKKLFVVSALLASSLIAQKAFADVLAQWTFETSSLGSTIPAFAPGANTTTTNFVAELGLQAGSAFAIGLHNAAATYTSPAGNGSTKALSANTWNPGDYFQFTLSTSGYKDLQVSFDQTGSGTGPSTFGLFYSVNGGSYVQFGANYTFPVNASPNPTWNGSIYSSIYTLSFDLSTVTALNGAATVGFRLVDMNSTSLGGGTVGTGGTDRVDNFTVTATAVPEPGAYALVGGFGLLMLCFKRRRVLRIWWWLVGCEKGAAQVAPFSPSHVPYVNDESDENSCCNPAITVLETQGNDSCLLHHESLKISARFYPD